MSSEKEILSLEDKRYAAMTSRDFGALATGKAHIEAEVNGQPRTLRLSFLNAWTKTPQGWKFVAWQSTPLPA
jgi:ketosteroid isomerase-like protein